MKILTIIKKEYKQIVKKKSFVISTILTPLLMFGFLFLPLLLQKVGRGEKQIDIADFSGFIAGPFLETSKTSNSKALQFNIISVKDTNIAAVKNDYAEKILNKEVDGLLLIPDEVKRERKIFFYALNVSDFQTNKYLSATIQGIISKHILIENKINTDLVKEATRGVILDTFKVKKAGVTKSSSGMEYMMSLVMLTIIFSILIMYGQLIMRGVMEEKNNRIVEVLISSTDTKTLFYGKILGIGLAGLTQVTLWILLGVIFLGRFSLGLDKNIVTFFTLELGIYFTIFFIIGYFMYSILFSIVGASVNTDQEAQQYAAPITYLMFIPFFVGIMVTQNPDTPVVIITSLFPLFSPILMFMRISVAVPAFSQILLSIFISVLFTLFLAWLGAKIFRTGILMYGKKPSIKEILKWLRYK